MFRKQLTVILCTAAMTGFILSGCSSSESAETEKEDTDSGQQEEEVMEEEEVEEVEEEASMDEEPAEEPEPEEIADPFNTQETQPTDSDEESSQTPETSTTPSVEPEEMELEGAQTMAEAPEIPLNTKAVWTTKEDERSEWYAFKTEAGSEDLTYQVAVGGMASGFWISIYEENQNDPMIEEKGNENGATKVIDLDDLKAGTTYYIYLNYVADKSYYVLITPVSGD